MFRLPGTISKLNLVECVDCSLFYFCNTPAISADLSESDVYWARLVNSPSMRRFLWDEVQVLDTGLDLIQGMVTSLLLGLVSRNRISMV